MAKKTESQPKESKPVKRAYYVPAYNVSVMASSIEEAVKLAKKGNK